MVRNGWCAVLIGMVMLLLLPHAATAAPVQARNKVEGAGKDTGKDAVKKRPATRPKAAPRAPVAGRAADRRVSSSAVRPGKAPAVRHAGAQQRRATTVRAASRGAAADSRQVRAARAAVAGSNRPARNPAVVRTGRAATAVGAVGAVGAASAASGLAQANQATGNLSIGEAIGLHRVPDPLALRSGVALVVDPANGEILYEKNSRAVLPIASITKVMTALVVLDARQPMDERLLIGEADRDLERGSGSRLPMGTTLTRREMLHLALMSSENRAASALARHYPGGMSAFVAAANRKAAAIGMRDSVFADGTGLSSTNVSTARDLVVMVAHAAGYPVIRDFSTAAELTVRTPHGPRVFRTTNRMVASPAWELELQKTGFISEAGNCLVIQGHVDGRPMIMVLLDSQGRYSRLGDAMRIRRFLEG